METIKVTQEDREAAATALVDRLKAQCGGVQPWMDASTQAMRLGEQDNHSDVQAFARHRLPALRNNSGAAMREAAWRDGFDCARQCLSDDEAFCLTECVEQDAWADSATRQALPISPDPVAAVPVGMALVPVEPTQAMIFAGKKWLANWHHMRSSDRENALGNAYRAMLAASPQDDKGPQA